MGERYLVSGVQLGMLMVVKKKEREQLLKNIEETQFVWNSENNLEKDIKKLQGERK